MLTFVDQLNDFTEKLSSKFEARLSSLDNQGMVDVIMTIKIIFFFSEHNK